MLDKTTSARALKFRELAEKRVAKAFKAIRLIGNLSNKTNYNYTDEEAKKIVKALQNEVSAVKRQFSESGNSDEIRFKL